VKSFGQRTKLMGSVAGLSRKPRPASLKKIVDKLLAGVADKDEEQRDISCLGKLSRT
jgi:hypothetical protein